MITKKCATSLVVFALSLLLIFAALYFMSLFTVSKWLGLGVGGGILVAVFIFLIFFKKWRAVKFFTIIIASLATGITISSIFVLYGEYPLVWQAAVLYACMIVLFYLYCLCANLTFLQNHCRIPLIIYALLLFTATILLFVFLDSSIYVLAIFSVIPLVAYLISISVDAYDLNAHFTNLAFCSFGILLVAVLVVLVVLSEGDALDGFDFDGVGGKRTRQRNPYDYLQ